MTIHSRLAAFTLAMAAALPASAQSDAPYAPCLTRQPDLAAYVAAFEAEGWTEITKEADLTAARDVVAQPNISVLYFADALETMADLQDFLNNAGRHADEQLGAMGFVARDGIVAGIERYPLDEGQTGVTCTLTAQTFPAVGDVLTGEVPLLDGTLLIMASVETPLPDGSDDLHVDAIRLDAPMMFRPALSGRESFVVTHRFPSSD